MAIDWGAFVKGWAGSASDSLKEREKAEKDKKLREDLLALQEKYKIAEEDRADAKAKKKVASEVPDYAKGVALLYNSDRELLGERPLTAAEVEDRTLDVDTKKAGLDNIRSTISSRAASDRNDAIRTANDGSRTRATIDSLRASQAGDGVTTPMAGLGVVDEVATNLIKAYGGKESEELPQNVLWERARKAADTALRAGTPNRAMMLFVDSIKATPAKSLDKRVKGR